MDPQFYPNELREIANFIEAISTFVDAHPLILDVDVVSERFNHIPYFDSNGDKLGEFQIGDGGDFCFVSGIEKVQ